MDISMAYNKNIYNGYMEVSFKQDQEELQRIMKEHEEDKYRLGYMKEKQKVNNLINSMPYEKSLRYIDREIRRD